MSSSFSKFKTINIIKKEWESDFFNKEYLFLEISSKASANLLNKDLKNLDKFITYDLLEVNLNSQEILLAEILENNGFKLIDSRIMFLTLIDLESQSFTYKNIYKEYNIRYLNQDTDKDSISNITNEYLTKNLKFVSRYKNHSFFKSSDAQDYFQTWIEYSLNKKETKTAVLEFENMVVGFFIFEKKEAYNNKALYKGILCAIDKKHQGKKLHLALQSFLFSDFEESEFYLDNTTQLSNFAVIKNHIRSNRQLHKIQLTFMKSNI